MPDRRYMDMALIPSILHIPPHVFVDYPPVVQEELRLNCLRLIGAGWAGNPQTVKQNA